MQKRAELDARRIRDLRIERGLDQPQLAGRAGVNPSHIYRMEKNEVPNASAIIVAEVSRALGTTVEYLVGQTDKPGRLFGESDRAELSESVERLALKVQKEIPIEVQETVVALLNGVIDSWLETTGASAKRRRLMRYFDSLSDEQQRDLLASAEHLRWGAQAPAEHPGPTRAEAQ